MRTLDAVHLALMLAALLLAYVLPFELLVLSYAILGPAHYLTEISWLHDRNYYLPQRSVAALFVAVALGAMFIGNLYWFGVVVVACFALCAILTLSRSRVQGLALIAIAALAIFILCDMGAPFLTAGILLTTFLHVCLFTLIFMIGGAQRAKSLFLWWLIGLYLVSIALILLLPPTTQTRIPALAALAQNYFGGVAPALGGLVGIPKLAYPGRISGLLSFVYTYHYLNWFVKADVIRWADVPRRRLIAIGAACAASTGLYLYDYSMGFMVLLLLSLIHILLEFPLNSISIRQLVSPARTGKPKRRAATCSLR